MPARELSVEVQNKFLVLLRGHSGFRKKLSLQRNRSTRLTLSQN